MGMLGQLAFFPSLAYNITRNYLNAEWWPWYTRIDERVVLGALPFKSGLDELIAKENIGGVVCLTEAHELNHSFVADEQDWKQRNVQFHWLPTPDWTHSPTVAGIRQAVHFINSFDGTGKSVYVHCKAGRSRSATVVACYLVTRHQWHSATALQTIYQKRHQIVLRAPQWRALIKYEQMELEKSFGDT